MPTCPEGHKFVPVRRETWELLKARNLRDTGRGVTAPHEMDDGSIAFLLHDDTLSSIEAVTQPGETQEDAIVRLLWTTHRLTPSEGSDEMPPHPKPTARAKKPGAMKTKPKAPKLNPPETIEEAVLRAKSGKVTKAELKAAIATKEAKAPKPKKAASAKPAAPSGTSKTDLIIAMLKKPGGASSKEMEAATGWKPHSVRGLLGTLRSKGTLIKAEKFAKGEPTVYSIDASAAATPAPAAEPAPETGDVI